MSDPSAPRRGRGKGFKPREPYTHRLRKILEEYPDGSQVLREILQNSDDAKSTEQIFILDHNKYPSNKLLEPYFVNNYQRTNLQLDRYQGPALLSKNSTIFEERDFQSLLKLADGEKKDQFDKIGGNDFYIVFFLFIIWKWSDVIYLSIKVSLLHSICKFANLTCRTTLYNNKQ